MDSYNSPTTKALYRGTQVVWYILGLIEILLLFRFVLKLLGANPNADFTSFIYDVAGIFLAPFLTVFQVTNIEGSIFEWATLLAMFVYWVIAWGIVRLLLIGRSVSTPEAAHKLDDEDK